MLKPQQFPFLRLYEDGVLKQDYNLAHDPSEIYKWVRKQIEPVVHLSRNREQLDKHLNTKDSRIAVVFFGHSEMIEYRAFWSLASQVLDAIFILNDDLATAQSFKVKQPSIMAFRREGQEDPPVLYGGNLSSV